jgi:bifunctional DNA-binding transcriptional regulator/antitoxin component of YhaV-PrlF toxin-antitoxin module
MALNITKMSANGQIVIPMPVRKSAKIKPASQFVVVPKGKDLLLKHISEEDILHEFDVMDRIDDGEHDIDEGRYVEADTSMGFEEIDELLMR